MTAVYREWKHKRQTKYSVVCSGFNTTLGRMEHTEIVRKKTPIPAFRPMYVHTRCVLLYLHPQGHTAELV